MLDRVAKPVKSRTQFVLMAGFGGLLALMAFAGIDSIRVLSQIQMRNLHIRQKFLLRNRLLEQIRGWLYISGTYTRDYLLDADPAHAESNRASLQQVRRDMESDLETYARSLEPGETNPFQALKSEIQGYWQMLDPVFHWTPAEKLVRREAFLHEEFFPRRSTTLQLADKIADLNDQELSAEDEELAQIFGRFRWRLTWVLLGSLGLGVALATATIRHIVRLERQTYLRYEQVVHARAELKELSARLVDAQENERRAISRELHDEVGQSLSAVLMELGNLAAIAPSGDTGLRRHIEAIRKLVESSVAVVRNMALLLRPSMLDDLGLVPALQWQAREISKRTGMRVEVAAENVADDLPEGHRTCVYRVVQEALNNCAHHARAGTVRIAVVQEETRVLLAIHDDGQGFASDQVRGLGLLGMEERVTHLGGAFRVKSAPGQGTELSIELPLAAQSAPAIA